MSLKYEGYKRNEFEAYGEIISHSIACLVILILFVIYVKYFCIQNKTETSLKNKIFERFRLILLGSLMASLMYILGTYTFNIIFGIILGNRSNYGCFMRMCWVFVIAFQRIAVYLFFIYRLYVTFTGSYLEIKKRTVNIILLMIVIIQLSTATAPFIFSYLADNFLCENGTYATQWILSLVASYLIDTGCAIALSCLYIKKLRQFRKITPTDGKKDDKLFGIVNKLTLLTLVTVISTSLLAIIAWGLMILPYPLACFDSIINNVCVMLSFVILEKSYKKYCCCCIRIQNTCCIGTTKDEIELKTEIVLNESKSSK